MTRAGGLTLTISPVSRSQMTTRPAAHPVQIRLWPVVWAGEKWHLHTGSTRDTSPQSSPDQSLQDGVAGVGHHTGVSLHPGLQLRHVSDQIQVLISIAVCSTKSFKASQNTNKDLISKVGKLSDQVNITESYLGTLCHLQSHFWLDITLLLWSMTV